MAEKEKLHDFVIGSVPTLMYMPDFVTDDEQTQLLNNIYQAPISKWKTLKNRRLQNWGGVVHEKGLLGEDLPPWLAKVTQRLFEESKIFPAEPNHVLINEYLPNQGIMPHQDGPAYFPAAAILSLGSPAVMDFTLHSKLKQCQNTSGGLIRHDDSIEESLDHFHNHHQFSVLLMPRSLLIFKDMAYSDYLHGIEESIVQQYDGAINLFESVGDAGVDRLLPGFQNAEEAKWSEDVKLLRRTNKRISLTCRLVLKFCKMLKFLPWKLVLFMQRSLFTPFVDPLEGVLLRQSAANFFETANCTVGEL
ncbi:hypothetical protein Ancab_024790 [Ancistrocladus abbreviatus]